MDLAEYRQVSRDTWQRMASGWDRRRDWMWDVSRAIGEHMVAKLDPRPGQTVLELACGTGETGFAAAARLGDEGKLIATDFAPEMVEATRRRAQELGLRNVELRVMDAEQMDLGDDSVDGVLCRWGYMLMADPAGALAETRRVLRDGGRLSLSVWGPPQDNPWAALGGSALVALGHIPAPEPGAPGIFAMSDKQRIRELVTGAGFGDPGIEAVQITYRFEDFEDYWRFLGDLAGAIALVLARLSDDERSQLHDTIEQNAHPYRQNDGSYTMPGVALNAVAD